MTRDRDIERILDRWFEEGPTEVADRVIGGALDTIETTQQRHVSRVLRRYPSMTPFSKLAAAAVVVAVVGGLAFVILQPNPVPPVGTASAAPTAAASPAAPSGPLPTATLAPTATASAAGGNATAIAAGGRHTCALTRDGGVKCWGDNFFGELGNGSTTNSSAPVDVSGLTSGVRAIALGFSHSCALSTEGGVNCWGYNESYSLGDGTDTNRATPVEVAGLTDGIAAITVGFVHACALTIAGAVKCWGGGGDGQLGDGSSKSSRTPVDVSGLSGGVTSIAAGGEHTCALMSGGGVKCWGGNHIGQLGNGSTTSGATPVDVSGLASGVTSIVAGDRHTCALMSAGGIKCWGFNAGGQLGTGSLVDSSIPVDVAGLASGVTAMAAGLSDAGGQQRTAGRSHTCALTSTVGVQCWGGNYKGQLGDGTLINSSTPVDVSGLGSGVSAITVGGAHTCALMTGGGVACWGSNSSGGQLGDGTTTDSSTPVVVSGL